MIVLNTALTSFFAIFMVVIALYGVQALVSGKLGSEAEARSLVAEVGHGVRHFIAVEYYWGILNRTYVVFVTDQMICGAKVRGALPAPIRVNDRWKEPYFYAKSGFLKKLIGVVPGSPSFLKISRANFRVERDTVENVVFTTEAKWGMGTVPYSGRIFITVTGGRKREFILVGIQDGESIKKLLSESSNVAA